MLTYSKLTNIIKQRVALTLEITVGLNQLKLIKPYGDHDYRYTAFYLFQMRNAQLYHQSIGPLYLLLFMLFKLIFQSSQLHGSFL